MFQNVFIVEKGIHKGFLGDSLNFMVVIKMLGLTQARQVLRVFRTLIIANLKVTEHTAFWSNESKYSNLKKQ